MHSTISRNNGDLFMENIALNDIADQFGTPCYVYSKRAIELNYSAYVTALGGYPHLVCYAVKSNSNIAVLQTLAALGAGFDIVSIGELERVLLAGGDPSKVVFSGLAKTADEMNRALEAGIHCFNVESESELVLLNATAASLSVNAPVSIRVNPDVDAKTHPYISTGLKEDKFGIDIDQALGVYERAAQMDNIDLIGVDCHIGSQLTEVKPFLDAMARLLILVDQLTERDIPLAHIDIGGGLGVRYQNEQTLSVGDYMAELLPLLAQRNETLILEPGRSITANAGVLLTRVQYLKSNDHKNFAIVNAAMNDMLRPSLYQAWMDIQPISIHSDSEEKIYDVVGPVCESGDFLGKDRTLSISEGDYLCLFSAGSYGFVMSSNYNSRPRVAEIMVAGEQVHLIRQRETLRDLVRGEQLLPVS
ncbi:MAG: diaminopimelate decarboxylase [Porticoccaceae bacterium]|nr:diaminopimelate decarboxylase [Porticoccaceae bacterium]|tara:strand:- start:4685 stop:5941 length:1257 start_codon:yes stop_codon:yes gene_type:complete